MDRLRYGTLVISPVLRNGGFVFVGKKKVGEDLAALNQFARELYRFDGSPLIFPDGRLTRDGSLGTFYLAGLEAIRRNSRLPVLPVVIDGLWKAPTLGHYRRIVDARVRVRILSPIPCETIDRDPRAAYESLEASFRQNLDEIRRGGA
jgi:1-acyl-sn-glycerol-3-phosphate acyltransferase